MSNYYEKEHAFKQVRKIKPTHLSVSGLLPFKDGVSIPYESTLERDFLLYFTYLPSVEEIIAQPARILFVKNGMTYPYTPDYLIRFNDGRRSILVEVKPKSKWQEHWRDWKEKWKAAMEFCKKMSASSIFMMKIKFVTLHYSTLTLFNVISDYNAILKILKRYLIKLNCTAVLR